VQTKKKYYKVAGIKNYIEEIVNELTNKVSWPTWQDLQTSSIIVLVTSVILALIIWLMD
jgi:preprotein translocase subunit SecE